MFQKGQKPPVKGKAKKKKARKPLPVFKPPEDFKAAFIEVKLRIGKDGIIEDCTARRYAGRTDTDNVKVLPMQLYDMRTMLRIGMRLAGANFIRNEGKRLPGNSTAVMLIRVGTNSKTDGLVTRVREIKFQEGRDGKMRTLNRKNPIFRALRKANRVLPGAFTTMKPFPTKAEYRALTEPAEKE